MGTDRPFEQRRNIGRTPGADDTRAPHKAPPPKTAKEDAVTGKARTLLLQYLAADGDWDEVHLTSQRRHAWRFTRCECPICTEAVKLVGEPETPNG